jgi:carboxymethylenebutenolidase
MAYTPTDITTPDGVCDSYIAYPDSGGPFPAVILYMDAIGIRPVLQRMAERIAANGFYVLMPNLFYRQGRAQPGEAAEVLKPENRPKLIERMQALTPDAVSRDAGVFLKFIASQKNVKSGSKVGLTGYCMGGGMALRTAEAYPDRVAAAASFHGGNLATEAPDSPHRLVGQVKGELYFGHADQDRIMPPEDIARLDGALQAAKVRYQSELYHGALHGYTMPDLPAYNKAAEDRHWERLLALFQRTLNPA